MKLSNKDLSELYKMMVLIRESEESLVEPILNKEIHCPCHLYCGQEAVAAGLSYYLGKDDFVFGNHRSHGHYLAKGGDLKKMFAEIYCRESGCAKGRGGSMHLIDTDVGMYGAAPIVAGTISLSLGAAMASRINGEHKVSISYFGDGATGEGVLFESLNFASLKKLPIIFVCENNLYSTHLSIDEIRSNRNISKVADAFDIKSYRVDGNNVQEMARVGYEAINYARESGPVFIEALTYRQRGHVGPDDNIQGVRTDIRPKDELAGWIDKDPIKLLEKQMLESGEFTREELESLSSLVKREVGDAHEWAKLQPKPVKEELSYHVFK